MSGLVGQVGARSGVLGSTTDSTQLDYEEGTWTPVIIGDGGQSGQSYSTQSGKYVKVGDAVHCMFSLQLSNEGTFSGTYLLLSGFPFTVTAAPNPVHANNCYFVGVGTNVISIGLQLFQGGNKAYIWAVKSAGGSRAYLATNELANSTQLTAQFTYFV